MKQAIITFFQDLQRIDEPVLESAAYLRTYPSTYSVWQAIASVAKADDIDYAIIIRNPSAILSTRFMESIQQAINELVTFDCEWLVACGGGLDMTGNTQSAVYLKDTPYLRSANLITPVTDIFTDIYVLNVNALRSLNTTAIADWPNETAEILLIYLGYLHGFVSVYHPGIVYAADEIQARDLDYDDEMTPDQQPGYTVQNVIPTLSGEVHISTLLTEDEYAQSRMEPELFAETVEKAILTYATLPSFSIITRTQFRRLNLLKRMLASLGRAAKIDNINVECIISTDEEEEVAEEHFQSLQASFPDVSLKLVYNQFQDQSSRVGNLLTGVFAASNEYVWIMDDDDYFDRDAFLTLKIAFFLGQRPLVVCSSDVFNEKWESNTTARDVLMSSEKITTYWAHNWRNAFSGINPLPICGYIVPREYLVNRLEQFTFNYDFSEDYALLLLIFTGHNLPAIHEVNKSVCNISIRADGDNVVNLVDRSAWLRDIAQFLMELQENLAVTSPGQWQILNLTANRQALETLRQENHHLEKQLQFARTRLEEVREERQGLQSMLMSLKAKR